MKWEQIKSHISDNLFLNFVFLLIRFYSAHFSLKCFPEDTLEQYDASCKQHNKYSSQDSLRRAMLEEIVDTIKIRDNGSWTRPIFEEACN